MTRRIVAVAFAATLFLVGCNDDKPDDAASTDESQSTVGSTASTTSSSSSTTATTLSILSPEDQVRKRVADLLELRDAIFQRPDLSRIGEYAAPGSPIETNDQAQLTRLVNEGGHFSGPTFRVLGVRLDVLDPGHKNARLTFVAAPTEEIFVLDDAGADDQVARQDREPRGLDNGVRSGWRAVAHQRDERRANRLAICDR